MVTFLAWPLKYMARFSMHSLSLWLEANDPTMAAPHHKEPGPLSHCLQEEGPGGPLAGAVACELGHLLGLCHWDFGDLCYSS